MAIYIAGLCFITLVLVLSFKYVQNQVTRNKLLGDSPIRQTFGNDRIAEIINIKSYGIDFKDGEVKCNFTAPGRGISQIKCLEYIWDEIKKERRGRLQQQCQRRYVGGGRGALYGEFPHMGAVGWRSFNWRKDKWVYKCGASLISDKFLITAAHCSRLAERDHSVYNHVPEVVKLGDKFIKNKVPTVYTNVRKHTSRFKRYWYRPVHHKISNHISGRDCNIESQILNINRIIKYPEYVAPRHYYDIALIELKERVTFGPLIRPACLWNSHDTSDIGNVTVSGWGEVNPVTRLISEELQVGDVGIIDNPYCDSLLRKKHNRRWRGLSNHQFCAGVLSGAVDTCRGDSGGPLQAKVNISLEWPVYYLIGVTSFSYGCMHSNVPGIYVKVASFIDWIESIVWPAIY